MIRQVVAEIAEISAADGLAFDTSTMTTRVMREDAEYHGVRVIFPAKLDSARIKVQLDLSFGDPLDVRRIQYPTLLDDGDIDLLGYPVTLVLAEKLATMMSRGQANTRDRDFADVAVLTRVHTVDATELRDAVAEVARHRGHEVTSLGITLDGHADSRQSAWRALRDRARLTALPEDFAEVIAEVARFVDPIVEEANGLDSWDPARGRWSNQAD